jgi:hypothetical protein
MNERTIGRRIIDHTDPWKIAQQLRDATDVLRIAVGEHQPCEPIHAGPVQILAHDALVSAFAPAIEQPVVAIHSDVNGLRPCPSPAPSPLQRSGLPQSGSPT